MQFCLNTKFLTYNSEGVTITLPSLIHRAGICKSHPRRLQCSIFKRTWAWYSTRNCSNLKIPLILVWNANMMIDSLILLTNYVNLICNYVKSYQASHSNFTFLVQRPIKMSLDILASPACNVWYINYFFGTKIFRGLPLSLIRAC